MGARATGSASRSASSATAAKSSLRSTRGAACACARASRACARARARDGGNLTFGRSGGHGGSRGCAPQCLLEGGWGAQRIAASV